MSLVEVLRTDRLTLRRLTPEDAAFIHELTNDPDWLRHIGDRGIRTLDDARAYIERGPMAMYAEHGFGLWCVERREDGTPIGMCGLLKRATLPDVDIGFAFLPRFRGRGYAHEAAAATLDYGRRALGLGRIVAIVSPGNDASMRLLRKLGLEQERTIRFAPDGDDVCLFGPSPSGARQAGAAALFTAGSRQALRDALVAAARADARITGAALTGSAARGAEDRWSDIDLALAVAGGADRDALVAEWTARMYREHGAVHHADMAMESVLFRVFLLADTLQVDLAFWPEAEFGAMGPGFRLLFGSAAERTAPPPPSAGSLVGMAWLHALHARSSLARGRPWQAEYMISGARDHVLALACLRHGVPAVQGRGMDDLPPEATSALDGALVRSLDPSELARALGVVCEALIAEAEHLDPELARRLAAPVRALTILE